MKSNRIIMMMEEETVASDDASVNKDHDKEKEEKETQPKQEDSVPKSLEDFVIGMQRRKAEMKIIGGLLLILGSGAAHSALALCAVVIEGMTGRDQVMGFKLPVLVGSFLQCCTGMVSMIVGLCNLLSAPVSKKAHVVAKVLLLLGNLAPITIIFSIVRIISGTRQDPSAGVFVPSNLQPTRGDNHFIAFNGIVGLIAVCVTLLGGINLLSSNLCAFIGDQGTSRNRLFYKIRYGYHSILVTLGGWSQLVLGLFCWARYGGGPYSDAVHVTVYTIFYPQLSCVVGIVQTFVGLFGLLRVVGLCHVGGTDDHRFEVASLVSWFVTMVFQIVVQPSYASGDAYDAEGATFASVYLGFFIIPAWLDYCIRITPEKVWPEAYAIPTEVKERPDRPSQIYLFICDFVQKKSGSQTASDDASSTSEESNGSSERVVL